MSVTTPAARKMIGKRVKYVTARNYATYKPEYSFRFGTVEQVWNRNVLIGGDWHWLPDMHSMEEAPKEDQVEGEKV